MQILIGFDMFRCQIYVFLYWVWFIYWFCILPEILEIKKNVSEQRWLWWWWGRETWGVWDYQQWVPQNAYVYMSHQRKENGVYLYPKRGFKCFNFELMMSFYDPKKQGGQIWSTGQTLEAKLYLCPYYYYIMSSSNIL